MNTTIDPKELFNEFANELAECRSVPQMAKVIYSGVDIGARLESHLIYRVNNKEELQKLFEEHPEFARNLTSETLEKLYDFTKTPSTFHPAQNLDNPYYRHPPIFGDGKSWMLLIEELPSHARIFSRVLLTCL